MDGVAVEPSRADARAPPARLEIECVQVSRGDRARRSQTGTDAFAPAREARKVMKVDRAGEDDVVVFRQRAVEFDGRAAADRAELHELRRIFRIVFERAHALQDEGREQFALLRVGHGAMNAGGEDDAQVRGRNAELDETPDEQVDDLPGGGRARRIRDDDEHAFVGRDDVFERRRVNGVVDQRAHLRIRERTLGRLILRRENLKAFVLVHERDAPPAVS